MLRHEDDIEKRIQARIAKDGIRIKEFFIDFDKLRKGTVGEAAVSYLSSYHMQFEWTSQIDQFLG